MAEYHASGIRGQVAGDMETGQQQATMPIERYQSVMAMERERHMQTVAEVRRLQGEVAAKQAALQTLGKEGHRYYEHVQQLIKALHQATTERDIWRARAEYAMSLLAESIAAEVQDAYSNTEVQLNGSH